MKFNTLLFSNLETTLAYISMNLHYDNCYLQKKKLENTKISQNTHKFEVFILFLRC